MFDSTCLFKPIFSLPPVSFEDKAGDKGIQVAVFDYRRGLDRRYGLPRRRDQTCLLVHRR